MARKKNKQAQKDKKAAKAAGPREGRAHDASRDDGLVTSGCEGQRPRTCA